MSLKLPHFMASEEMYGFSETRWDDWMGPLAVNIDNIIEPVPAASLSSLVLSLPLDPPAAPLGSNLAHHLHSLDG